MQPIKPLSDGFTDMDGRDYLLTSAKYPSGGNFNNFISPNYNNVLFFKQCIVEQDDDNSFANALLEINVNLNSNGYADYPQKYGFVWDAPDGLHDYYMDCRSQGANAFPPMILIVSGKAKAWFNFQESTELHLRGAVGRLLHPISTPDSPNIVQRPDAWTDLTALMTAANYYCNEVSCTPQKYDVALLQDGTKYYYNGTAWQTDRVPYVDPNDLEYAQLQREIAGLTTELSNTSKAVGTLSLHLTQEQTKLTNLNASLATITQVLNGHIKDDAKLRATLWSMAIAAAQQVYAGTLPDMDMDNPIVAINAGSLVDLGTNTSYTVPENGFIVATYSALLGTAPTLTINDVEINYIALSVLGSGSPSEPIQVSTGDIIKATGLLGLGSSFNVTFYPNKPV